MRGTPGPVVLFDGFCPLCTRWVDFVLRHDGGSGIRFAPLGSEAAQRLLARAGAGPRPADSVVLVDEEGVWTESTAVLRIVRRLALPWRLAWGVTIVPRALRDRAYRWVARNRYAWFGRRDVCRLPTAAERERFLD